MRQYVLPNNKRRNFFIAGVGLVIVLAAVIALYRHGVLATIGENEPEPRPVVVALPPTSQVPHSLLREYDGTPSWQGVVEALRFPGLLRPDASLQLVPLLAESFDVQEQARMVSFTLSGDAMWRSNDEEGTERPVTAEDVAATWRLALRLEPELSDAVASIEQPSAGSIVLKLKTVSPGTVYRLATIGILPAEQVEGISTAEQLDGLELWHSRLSAGPYFLVDDSSSEASWTFEAEPQFMGKSAAISTLTIRFDDTADADVVVVGSNPLSNSGNELEQQLLAANFTRIVTPRPTYVSVALNLGRGPTKNLEIRQALSLGVDRNRLVDGVLEGNGLPASSPFMPGTWAASEQDEAVFSPEQARQVLTGAGYGDEDGDGFLEDGAGKPLEIELLVPDGVEGLDTTGELLIGMWQEIGVRARTEKLQSEAFLKRVYLDRSFDAFIFMWPVTTDPDPSTIWGTDQNRRGGINPVGFITPRVDDLLSAGQSTLFYKERQETYLELANLMREEVPHLFLYWPGDVTMVHPDLEGVKPAIRGTSWDLTEWFWRETASR